MTVGIAFVGLSDEDRFTLTNLLLQYDVKVEHNRESADVVLSAYPPTSHKPQISLRPADAANESQDIVDGSTALLPLSLVRSCNARLQEILDPTISITYRIITELPFSYNLVPSSIRAWFLRTKNLEADLSDHLVMDIARKSLVDAFRHIDVPVKRKSPPSLLVTHDVDTEKGLSNSLSLKAIERQLGIDSLWFLPSNEYRIDRSMAKELAENSTIGSHDVRHDGKLIRIRNDGTLVQRLRESRAKLEDLFETEITYFRAPLLQFNGRIARALNRAGYVADFSVPCWEPVYPPTMKGHGIGSTQPLLLEGITEFPLTLFQDHQVLNVMGLNTSHAVAFWLEQARLIRKFDGDLVLNVHPDYAFSRDLRGYADLLSSLLDIQIHDLQPNNA